MVFVLLRQKLRSNIRTSRFLELLLSSEILQISKRMRRDGVFHLLGAHFVEPGMDECILCSDPGRGLVLEQMLDQVLSFF